jgi:RNA polymerase sigma factor for flagellar operon FliA
MAAEERERVRRAVNALPSRCRLVLKLIYFDNLSQNDVAAMMGVSKGRLSHLKKDCLERLRNELECEP